MEHLTSEQQTVLHQELQRGSSAYVRNLAAAEAAVRRGQFNVAKVLRATANAQRTIAVNAARLLEAANQPAATALLATNRTEQEAVLAISEGSARPDEPLQVFLQRSNAVHERVSDLLDRSLASLAEFPDILERTVPMMLFSCRVCGNPVEGSEPKQCDLCGAIRSEFLYVGPFYSGTDELLGRITPQQAIEILQQGPEQVATLILGVDDELLRRKPSAEEWSIKEIVAHTLETDYIFVPQVQAILAKTPYLGGIAPWETHLGKGYEERTAASLTEQFRAARNESLALVRELPPHEWSRSYFVWGRNASILDVGTWHANHDIGHISQVRRLLAMWQVPATSL